MPICAARPELVEGGWAWEGNERVGARASAWYVVGGLVVYGKARFGARRGDAWRVARGGARLRLTVVELDGALAHLVLLRELVPAEVESAVAEVTRELVAGALDVFHDEELEAANERDHLVGAVRRELRRSVGGGCEFARGQDSGDGIDG